jgi:ligand-binding SRPBCC domain-containing protein
MKTYLLEREQWVPKPIDEVFAFFSRPENLQVLTPDWLDFRIVEAPQTLAPGALIRYRLRWHFLPIRWTTEITEWNPPHRFVDRELSGPYALWNHEHSFAAAQAGTQAGTMMRDRVSYALPLGPLGQLAHAISVKREVESIFDFRAKAMKRLFP